MVIRKFLAMAYRSVIRNTRRSALTALAVALGLVVVMLMSGLIEGMVANAIADNIRVASGHLQIRNASYDVEKASLLSRFLPAIWVMFFLSSILSWLKGGWSWRISVARLPERSWAL